MLNINNSYTSRKLTQTTHIHIHTNTYIYIYIYIYICIFGYKLYVILCIVKIAMAIFIIKKSRTININGIRRTYTAYICMISVYSWLQLDT